MAVTTEDEFHDIDYILWNPVNDHFYRDSLLPSYKVSLTQVKMIHYRTSLTGFLPFVRNIQFTYISFNYTVIMIRQFLYIHWPLDKTRI